MSQRQSAPSGSRVGSGSSSAARPIAVGTPSTPPVRTNVFVKHGKYIALGGAGVWYLDLVERIQGLLDPTVPIVSRWARRYLYAALGLHAITTAIFLYLVLFLPWVRGYIPNYPKWQQSKRLRIIVPALTSSILLGWSFFVVSLSKGTSLSVPGAMAGATALFTLTFGTLGLIPEPSNAVPRSRPTRTD